LQIEKLDSCPSKNPNLLVKVTEMGNITEIQYMSKRNNKQTIQMLEGGNQYMLLATGEILDVNKHNTRAEQKKSLYRTFKHARAIINTNVTDINNVSWITLTYKENMTDTKKLYNDFKLFNMRIQEYFKKLGNEKAEYIVMMEPQARGAWHAHLLYIFSHKAPFINNKDLAAIWGHGFVKIKKLDNVDNVGAYLTAYLGDMDLNECKIDNPQMLNIKEVTDEKNNKKYYVKGARLDLYPVNFNMIRCSRGVKKPISEMMDQKNAIKKVSAGTKTYEKTVKLIDLDNNFESIINTCYYNNIRK